MRPLSIVLVALSLACSHAAPPVNRAEQAARARAERKAKFRYDHPGQAEEYYAMKRAGAADPHERYAAARKQMAAMRRVSVTSAGEDTGAPLDWRFLGPGNIGGRTRTLVIDHTNHDVMYSGGVSGGVWKTTDAGARWEPVGDVLTNLAVNALVMDPQDSNVLFAGTGEGYFREEQRGTALPLRGNGIFVTRDGGATWQQLPSTTGQDFQWVNDLDISATDSSRIYAATRAGVFRSTDAGETWSRVLPVSVKGGCLQLTPRPQSDGDYLFASCGTFERATVYRNRNAESNGAWQSVLSEDFMGRTSVAVAPSQPSMVYALAASNEPDRIRNQGLLAVYRSDSNGDPGTWRVMVDNTDPVKVHRLLLTNLLPASAPECFQGQPVYVTMGWYCNDIEVDPLDPERVWVAGVDLFRSDDGGRNWGVGSYWWSGGFPGAFVHADHHAIIFHPAYDGVSNQKMFTTNDGGIYRTDNARANVGYGINAPCVETSSDVRFSPLNHNFGVTQFYHGAVFPDGRRFFGGAQDNGTLVGSIDDGPDSWRRILGGDGGYVAIDPTNANIIYAEAQGGALMKSENGGRNFVSAREGIADEFLFIAPFALDPDRRSRVWFGGRRMWRSNDGASTWTQASAPLDGRVSAIGIPRYRSERVLAGTSTGRIYRAPNPHTSTATTQWLSATPRSGFVSSIAFDPADASIAYATYAGFGGAHVWKSIDGGATWSSIDANLPDIPVHSIAIDPIRRPRLFLGTDLGVFMSMDGGAHWMPANAGFAAAVTETVVIGPGERGPAVYAFTHGRGAWRAELGVDTRRRSVR